MPVDAAFQPRALTYSGDFTLNTWMSGNEYAPDLHYHDFYEVQIYLEGSRHLVINGQTHVCSAGDVAFLNLFEQHQLLKNEPGAYRRCTFSISPSFLLSMCTPETDVRALFYTRDRSPPVRHFEPEAFAGYLDIIARYQQLDRLPGHDLRKRGLLFELFGRLYADCSDLASVNVPSTQHSSMVAKIVDHVNSHLDQELSLETLAAVSNFSVYHMCRVFKRMTGCTINQYISGKRMEQARLLLRSDCPIAQIAPQLGFRNYSCFYKSFVRETGISPAQYREDLKKQYD